MKTSFYGYEDDERFYRFNTMGYKVGRLDAHVYHMEHARTLTPGSQIHSSRITKTFGKRSKV